MDTILAVKHIEFSRGKTKNIDDKLQENDIEGACQIVEDMLKRRVGINDEEYNKMLFVIKVINMLAQWANGKDINEYYKNNIIEFELTCPKISNLLRKILLSICASKLSTEQSVVGCHQEHISGNECITSEISVNPMLASGIPPSSYADSGTSSMPLNRSITEEVREEEEAVAETMHAYHPTTITPMSSHSIVKSRIFDELIKGDFNDQERVIFLLLTNNLLISNILLSIANNIPKDEPQNDNLILTILEASSRGELGDLDIFFMDRSDQ